MFSLIGSLGVFFPVHCKFQHYHIFGSLGGDDYVIVEPHQFSQVNVKLLIRSGVEEVDLCGHIRDCSPDVIKSIALFGA